MPLPVLVKLPEVVLISPETAELPAPVKVKSFAVPLTLPPMLSVLPEVLVLNVRLVSNSIAVSASPSVLLLPTKIVPANEMDDGEVAVKPPL